MCVCMYVRAKGLCELVGKQSGRDGCCFGPRVRGDFGGGVSCGCRIRRVFHAVKLGQRERAPEFRRVLERGFTCIRGTGNFRVRCCERGGLWRKYSW